MAEITIPSPSATEVSRTIRPSSEAEPAAEPRAVALARDILELTAEVMLELEIPWNTARGLFAQVMFERARARYGALPKVAAALDTALRTVRRYASASRRRVLPSGPTYNMRARVCRALARGPMTLAELEHRFPRASDVNYARGALRSLVDEGVVTFDPTSGRFTCEPTRGEAPDRRRAELAELMRAFASRWATAELVAQRRTAA